MFSSLAAALSYQCGEAFARLLSRVKTVSSEPSASGRPDRALHASSSYGEQRIMTPVNLALQFCRNSRSHKSFRSAITRRGTIRTFYIIVRRQADRSAHVDGATDNSQGSVRAILPTRSTLRCSPINDLGNRPISARASCAVSSLR
jgi:hypothetical protein